MGFGLQVLNVLFRMWSVSCKLFRAYLSDLRGLLSSYLYSKFTPSHIHVVFPCGCVICMCVSVYLHVAPPFEIRARPH